MFNRLKSAYRKVANRTPRVRGPDRPVEAVAHTASLFDVLTTVLLLGWAASEANPVAAAMFDTFGLWPVAVASPLLVGLVVRVGRGIGERFNVPQKWQTAALTPMAAWLCWLAVRNTRHMLRVGLPEQFQWGVFGLTAAGAVVVALGVYGRVWRRLSARQRDAGKSVTLAALLVVSTVGAVAVLPAGQNPVGTAEAGDSTKAQYAFTTGSDSDAELQKISAIDGSLVWAYTGFSAGIRSVGVDSNGDAYAGGYDNDIRKIDGDSGDLVWSDSVGSAVQVVESTDSGVYVFAEGGLYKYAKDGSLSWSNTGVQAGSGSAIEISESGKLYVGNNPDLHRIDASNGDVIWTESFSSMVNGIEVDEADGHIYVTDSNPQVKKLELSDRSLIWETTLPDNAKDLQLDANNNIYTATIEPEVKKLDSTGTVVGTYPNIGNPRDVRLSYTGKLYVSDNNGVLTRLDKSDLSEVWSYTTPSTTYGINDIGVTKPPAASAVSGTVTSDGSGVGGVDVTVTDDSDGSTVSTVTTASDGSYSVDLQDGSYTVSTSYDGTDLNQAVTVSGSAVNNVDFGYYTLSGQVASGDEGLEGRTVNLSADGNPVNSDVTNATGHYDVSVANANYDVSVAYEDTEKTKTVEVAGSPVTADISFAPDATFKLNDETDRDLFPSAQSSIEIAQRSAQTYPYDFDAYTTVASGSFDSNGEFSTNGLENGTYYRITVQGDGSELILQSWYYSGQETVTITADGPPDEWEDPVFTDGPDTETYETQTYENPYLTPEPTETETEGGGSTATEAPTRTERDLGDPQGPYAAGRCTTPDGSPGAVVQYWDPDEETYAIDATVTAYGATVEIDRSFADPVGWWSACVGSEEFVEEPGDGPVDGNSTIIGTGPGGDERFNGSTAIGDWESGTWGTGNSTFGGGGGAIISDSAGSGASSTLIAVPAVAAIGFVLYRRYGRGGA